ncbi:multiple sugar transport system substrate-binding protein [Paenibacillus phyllosphaerae]|uniref:Multiple sugar transport system substrate-binding protein n=1 Tax=Paenibacillus phyllosphaerae TaxID=274593 RepID=A0A7W5AYR3_9BACL|nr:ABC transporter substrate-binding protein [Paenibacillus phyllosphaerae]MBB3111217.1 multiple sugar transport system substrate-binding protein [Paenibacillus phyllosphaerae]
MAMVLAVTVLLSGCHLNGSEGPQALQGLEQSAVDSEDKSLLILSTIEEQHAIVEGYKQRYPDITVNWELVKNEAMMERLAERPFPDLIIANNGLAGQLAGLDLFEDLNLPEYEGSHSITKQWYPGLPLAPFLSMNGQSLIAIPKDYPMFATFYRADLMERYGFPSEPDALASYMEDPQQWLEMAEALKAQGHYIIGFPSDVLQISTKGRGFFDPEGNYVRNDPELAKLAEVMFEVERKKLAAFANIWDEKGQQALRDDSLIMLYMGEWGLDLVKQWDPEHADQWRMTRLPFHAYAVDGGNSFWMMRSGTNKEAAWRYIAFSMEAEAPYRESLASWKWMGSMGEMWPSPLDEEASTLWMQSMQRPVQVGYTGEQLLQDIEARIRKEMGADLRVLQSMIE